jgi:hypothetical protein
MKFAIPLAFALFSGWLQAADLRESWTLILTAIDQPPTSVVGFTSESTCERASKKWMAQQRFPAAYAVCVLL